MILTARHEYGCGRGLHADLPCNCYGGPLRIPRKTATAPSMDASAILDEVERLLEAGTEPRQIQEFIHRARRKA